MIDVLRELACVNVAELDTVFRGAEVSGGVVGAPLIIRLDGVGFGSRLRGFAAPRDARVHRALLEAGRRVAEWFNADFAHVVSDEINVYLLRLTPYAGRYFKLVSIASGIASATVSLLLGTELFFDARVVALENARRAVDYYIYRTRVASGNLLTKLCRGCEELSYGEKLKRLEASIPRLEEWMFVGTCIYVEKYFKEAIDRARGLRVSVERRRRVSSSSYRICIEKLRAAAESAEPR